MKLLLARLAADWQERWGHPLAAVETFVDPQRHQGTASKVSGWSQLGGTKGFGRSAVDFYQPPERPKQVWFREPGKKACVRLRAAQLPPAWAGVAAQAQPRCTARAAEMRSLRAHPQGVPEFRRKQSLGHPVAGMARPSGTPGWTWSMPSTARAAGWAARACRKAPTRFPWRATCPPNWIWTPNSRWATRSTPKPTAQTCAYARERNRGRREIRVLTAVEVTPEHAGFPGARTIARLVRRVRRQQKLTTETVLLITSLTLAELAARGWLKHKRLDGVIESRLHHPLDISLDEDRSRVRQPKAAMVLACFRRLTVSLALHWVDQRRAGQRRATVRGFQKRFHHNGTGPQRLADLVFAKQPTAWACAD